VEPETWKPIIFFLSLREEGTRWTTESLFAYLAISKNINEVTMKTEGLTYSEAIEFAQAGAMISRSNWRNCFVFYQVENVVSPQRIPDMISLPASVKERLQGREILYKGFPMLVDTQYLDVDGVRVKMTPFLLDYKTIDDKEWYVL
jgi:hypothetical protein